MSPARFFFYTNIASPYRHHLWEAVYREFPGSAVIFTESMPTDRVWTDEASKHSYRYYRFSRNLYLPRIGWVSPGLIPWLVTYARGAIHMMGACGPANRYLIRYLAKPLGGRLVHCNDGAFAHRLSEDVVRRYRRRFLGAVPAVYTPGQIGRNYFRRLGYRDEQIFNSYFSHDVAFFASERVRYASEYRRRIRQELGIPEGDFVILTVSRLLGLKRLEDLHKALLILQGQRPDRLHIVLIGDGEHRQPVLDMRRDCRSVHVHWIKGVSYRDMPQYYAMSDVLVFPSEGDIWGLVVNEALSMGKPVICTAWIGASELVRDGQNGFVVPVRAPEDIANRIERIYCDRRLLKQMEESALEIMDTWNTDLAIESLRKLARFVVEDN
jgi:glycosyltransferase involved in cell wall biosynthesis